MGVSATSHFTAHASKIIYHPTTLVKKKIILFSTFLKSRFFYPFLTNNNICIHILLKFNIFIFSFFVQLFESLVVVKKIKFQSKPSNSNSCKKKPQKAHCFHHKKTLFIHVFLRKSRQVSCETKQTFIKKKSNFVSTIKQFQFQTHYILTSTDFQSQTSDSYYISSEVNNFKTNHPYSWFT